MIGVDALDALQELDFHYDVTAVRYARSSSEILWYRRIFSKDIVETTTWTHYVSLHSVWNMSASVALAR